MKSFTKNKENNKCGEHFLCASSTSKKLSFIDSFNLYFCPIKLSNKWGEKEAMERMSDLYKNTIQEVVTWKPDPCMVDSATQEPTGFLRGKMRNRKYDRKKAK